MRKGLERSTEITKGSGSCGRSKGLLHWLEFLKNLKGRPEFCHGLPPPKKKYSEALCGALLSKGGGFQEWISCWLGVTQHARSVSSLPYLPWLKIKSIIFGLSRIEGHEKKKLQILKMFNGIKMPLKSQIRVPWFHPEVP